MNTQMNTQMYIPNSNSQALPLPGSSSAFSPPGVGLGLTSPTVRDLLQEAISPYFNTTGAHLNSYNNDNSGNDPDLELDTRVVYQNHLDDVNDWIRNVIGGDVEVGFKSLTIFREGEDGRGVDVMWHLIGVDFGNEGGKKLEGDLIINAKVYTALKPKQYVDSAEGVGLELDMKKSEMLAKEALGSQLTNTAMYLGPNEEMLRNLWEPLPSSLASGNDVDSDDGILKFVKYGLRRKSNITRGSGDGKVLVVSGNAFISFEARIQNPSSSGELDSDLALDRVVKRILEFTTVRGSRRESGNLDLELGLARPEVLSCHFEVPEAKGSEKDMEDVVTVKGTGTSFKIICKVSKKVVMVHAQAVRPGSGVLMKKYSVVPTQFELGETKGTESTLDHSTIELELVTWKAGKWDVEIWLASAQALVLGRKVVHIEVLN